jgi:fibro-slime domain-containing protein
VPSDWGGFYFYVDGNFGTKFTTETNGWIIADLNNTYPSYDIRAFTIVKNNDYNNNQTISMTGYNRTGHPESGLTTIPCPNDGEIYYLTEDGPGTGKTYFSKTPPNAYYFYFLPPKTKSWLEGIPYIVEGGGTRRPMSIDPDRCGWYRAVYWNEELPTLMVIGLGPTLQESASVGSGAINLKERFATLGKNHIFYTTGDNRWHSEDPDIIEAERCNYSFAAFIYYRTVDENTDGFSWYSSSDMSPFGICKGIVKETLDAKGKIQFNSAACANANSNASGWVNADNFNNAFRVNPGKSEMRCWNMPFQKTLDGLWQFDANYLCRDGLPDNTYLDYNSTATTGCSDNKGNVGGFYPGFGARGINGVSGTTLDGDRIGVKKDYQWCFDRGWNGSSGSVVGDLSNKNTKAELDAEMRRVCGASAGTYPLASYSDTGVISSAVAAHDTYSPYGYGVAKNVTGGHMCFESQSAEFAYTPGQEFFFRGDDDIWVFISNYLAIDLGGNHMPAPGYIKLDTLRVPENARIAGKQYGSGGQLVEGEKYPVKIFFCDRRGTGSNIRIATNLYFAQTIESGSVTGLFLQENRTICLNEMSGSCALLSETESVCGEELAPRLSYKMSILTDPPIELSLNAGNTDCIWPTATLGRCYGGIVINNGKVTIDESAISDEFLKSTDFEIYASVSGYSPLKVSTSTGELVNIQKSWQSLLNMQEPAYYNLKGKPLGNKKPTAAGVYIMRQNGKSKPIVVR